MKWVSAKKTALYGLLTAAALLFGYVEYLVPLNFIAPGVKIGFANVVILLLILWNRPMPALFINIARIILSALLFATPATLMFSLTAGIISTLIMILLSRFKKIGVVGISVVGSVLHNLAQLFVANLTVGQGVWFYMPILLICGMIAGIFVGLISWMIVKKVNVFEL